MKNKIKLFYKGISVVLICILAVFLSNPRVSLAYSKESNVRKAYQRFIESQKDKKEYKDGIYATITKSSRERSPVLLISSSVFKDGKKRFAISAKVYNYVNNKVVYVTTLSSTGTAYPLCRKGKYLLAGEHHTSTQVMVSMEKAYFNMVTGLYMEGMEDCYKISWTESAGKIEKSSIKLAGISYKRAEKSDYYYDIVKDDYKGKPIEFEKF